TTNLAALTIGPLRYAGGRAGHEPVPVPVPRSPPMAVRDNPLLAPSDLPYQLPPFTLIDDDHFLPAFEQGMAEHRAEVEEIATNPEPPTVENTLVALERSGRLLARVQAVFGNLTSADTNPARQQIEQE